MSKTKPKTILRFNVRFNEAFSFFKIALICDYGVQNTEGEVFLCKKELFILFIYYSFSIRLYSQGVTMMLFTASPTNLSLLDDFLMNLLETFGMSDILSS